METHQESKSYLSTLSRNLLILAAVCLATWYFSEHFRISLTNSLAQRAFWIVEDPNMDHVIRTGSFVVFRQFVPKPGQDVVVDGPAPKGGRMMNLIKRVGCSPGEMLAVSGDDYYYCNGNYLGKARTKSEKGDRMFPFHFNGPVPLGMYFAIGDHPDSFDSRYYGFISRSRIMEVAWALF